MLVKSAHWLYGFESRMISYSRMRGLYACGTNDQLDLCTARITEQVVLVVRLMHIRMVFAVNHNGILDLTSN